MRTTSRTVAAAGSPRPAIGDRGVIPPTLDGIALAIELAAGRLLGFGVQGLANALEDYFSVLTRGRRTALPRHQTLRATLDWSYRLLSPEDQEALRCLSVFNGRFTLDDAAFVMGPLIRLGEASDRLTSLLDKSLVVARTEERTFRSREEFRAPLGVRKSPRKEPAGCRRWSMGISVFG
jgi:predicted ATPase